MKDSKTVKILFKTEVLHVLTMVIVQNIDLVLFFYGWMNNEWPAYPKKHFEPILNNLQTRFTVYRPELYNLQTGFDNNKKYELIAWAIYEQGGDMIKFFEGLDSYYST